MNRYLIHYPRDFANEYAVYAGPRDAIDKLEALLSSLSSDQGAVRRLTRAEAIERGWKRPKEAKETGEQWYGGFAIPESEPGWYDTLAEAIAGAERATEELVAQAERATEELIARDAI